MNCREYEQSLYLAHYGVKGTHWGVRRYQNEDGSYKPGAEGRYDPEPTSGVKRKQRASASEKRQLTEEELAARKAKRRDTLKKVAIGAGVAAGVGLGAYAGSQYIKRKGATVAANRDIENMRGFYRNAYQNGQMKDGAGGVEVSSIHSGKSIYDMYMRNASTHQALREVLSYTSTGKRLVDLEYGTRTFQPRSTAGLAVDTVKSRMKRRGA